MQCPPRCNYLALILSQQKAAENVFKSQQNKNFWLLIKNSVTTPFFLNYYMSVTRQLKVASAKSNITRSSGDDGLFA